MTKFLKLLLACMLFVMVYSLCTTATCAYADQSEKQYLLLTGEEYRSARYSMQKKNTSESTYVSPVDEKVKGILQKAGVDVSGRQSNDILSIYKDEEALLSACKDYVRENYDVVFKYQSKRAGATYLFFGFNSKLVLEFHAKYGYYEYGKLLSGNLQARWIVQYEKLEHTVTYKLSGENNNLLYIVDHTNGIEFFSDYRLSDIDEALDMLYHR